LREILSESPNYVKRKLGVPAHISVMDYWQNLQDGVSSHS